MGYFKVLDDKNIVKADSRLFWTPIFSTISYNYLDKNESF